MDKPTDLGNQTKNENSSGDMTPSRNGGNNNIDLGCGPTSSSTKLVNGSTSSSPSTTRAAASTTKTTIPLPLGAPLPTTTSTLSTLQQTTMPRFVSNATASNTQQQQQQQQQQQKPINLSINTTTGGNFDVTVDPNVSVENLKKIIAKKLKVAKDRIRLLHRERELQDGSLKDYNLMDGSKIILIPNVETGLLAQRPENTVMQALESLNDSQVNDFLSGKTPLNLSMRLGDHMMLIQLQLSTINPANNAGATNGNGSSCSSSRTRSSSQRSTRTGTVTGTSAVSNHHTHHHHHHHHHHRSSAQASPAQAGHATMATSSNSMPITMLRKTNGDTMTSEAVNRISVGSGTTNSSSLNATSTSSVIKSSDLSSFLSKRDYESLQNIVKSFAMTQPSRLATAINTNTLSAQPLNTTSQISNSQGLRTTTTATSMLPAKTTNFPAPRSDAAILEQSPIKSLSNLVSSSPIETTSIKNIPTAHGSNGSSVSILGTPVGTISGANNASVPPTVSTLLSCQDPIAAKLTSCLCTRLNASNGVGAVKNCVESSCVSRQDTALTNGVPAQRPAIMATSTPSKTIGSSSISSPPSSASMLHKTANNPIVRSKHRHHHHHHHHHHHYHHHNGSGSNGNTSSSLVVRPKAPNTSPRCISVNSNASIASNDSGFASDDSMQTTSTPILTGTNNAMPATTSQTANTRSSSSISSISISNSSNSSSNSSNSSSSNSSNNTNTIEMDESGLMTSDTRTLAEASRNLTQTLRKLSKEVFTNKIDLSSSEDTSRKGGSGAVIESMKNHGKGIYSGTFSGTLNPALQDRYGRPKRDISTVIHILNDLLSATPQYSRGARISFESPAASSSASINAGTNVATIANSSRSKQLQLKHAHTHSQSCVKCLKSQALFGQQSNSSSSSTSSNITNANTMNNSNANCAYGECNGHFTNNIGSNKNAIRSTHYAWCDNVSHNVNGNNQTIDSSNVTANDRNVCSCRYRTVSDGGETIEREREHTCQKCLSEMEMLRTKSKLDQLRLVMQQRKQKREARKLKGAPYGARVVGTTATSANIENADISEATTSSTTVAAAAAVASAVDAGTTTATSLKNSSSSNSTTLTTAPPSEVSPNHIVEEVDTAA